MDARMIVRASSSEPMTPAPIACIFAWFDSFTNPAIAPAIEFGFDFDEIFKTA